MRLLCVFVLMSAAVADDIRRYRISNRIILAGLIMGLVCLVASSHDYDAIGLYVVGAFIGLVAGMVLYATGAVGAGDAKLFITLGLLLGGGLIVRIIGISLFAGVVVGLVENIFTRRHGLHRFHYSVSILIGVVMVCLTDNVSGIAWQNCAI